MAKSKVSQSHSLSKSHGSKAETGQEKVPLKRTLSSPEVPTKLLKTGKPAVKSTFDPKGVLAPLRANAQVARNLVGDFTVVGRGSDTVFSLIPNTPAAEDWVAEHLPEDAMRFGRGICIEHRHIADIVHGFLADGLTVTQ
jgi:hypothetical protein